MRTSKQEPVHWYRQKLEGFFPKLREHPFPRLTESVPRDQLSLQDPNMIEKPVKYVTEELPRPTVE
jgi:hypothetical protein